MKKILLSGAVAIAILIGIFYQHFGGHLVTAPTITPANANVSYKNGVYTGGVTNAYYGNVQVQVTIASGKVSGVNFLQYPNDRSTSRSINGQAMPYLQREAIAAQTAQVNGVSGATATSQAFQQSLASALSQAQS
ncbi:MAG: FMN-binding protein [Candidatus Doudnabacteria bacterium]|nr:FMN-binding protein [Candidatus Doudnabacteria bacterium]